MVTTASVNLVVAIGCNSDRALSIKYGNDVLERTDLKMFNTTDSLVFTVGDVYWSYKGSSKVLIVRGILKDEQGYTRNFDHLSFVLRDGSMDMINEFMARFWL